MNERIQELYKEAVNSASAELHEWNKNWQPGKHTNFEYEKVLYKKFAELIVKECADVAYKTSWDDLVHGYGQAVIPLHLHNTIKEHFGVEE